MLFHDAYCDCDVKLQDMGTNLRGRQALQSLGYSAKAQNKDK